MDRALNDTRRVLLIEDSRADATIVSQHLSHSEQPPFDLVVASSLGEGLKRLRSGFDVVLLDLKLPDSEGADTLLKLRNVAPSTPVVVLSGTEDIELARRCIEWGASAFLSKAGLSRGGLWTALRGTIERHGR